MDLQFRGTGWYDCSKGCEGLFFHKPNELIASPKKRAVEPDKDGQRKA